MTQQPARGYSLPVVIIIALIAFGMGAGVGILGFVTVMGGSGEASTEIDNVVPTLAPAKTSAPAATEEPTSEATADSASAPGENANVASAAAPKTFRIDPEQSEVVFFLQEDLRGIRTDVVGRTNEIGGEIRVDFANLAESQIGGIVINSRTLATDNPMRNSAIRSQILRSVEDDYEFITFTPTSITGLPSISADPNNIVTFQFQVTGDLHIIEITQPVTFEVSATVDGTQLTGTATTIVKRSDFNLNIPNVPSVANVTDEVTLTLNFVAVESVE